MRVIRNGVVVDPSQNIEAERDLLIDAAGMIADIGTTGAFAQVEAEEIIDASGKWVIPGLVDVHVHLREPGFEWKETVRSGAEAAVLGGFTSICSMPNTNPVNDTEEVTRYIVEKGKQADCARVFPIGAVSMGLQGKQMAQLTEMREAGAIAFSDDGEPVFDAGLMRRALEWASMLGATISCHEEDKSLSCHGSMNEGGMSTKLGLRGWPKVAEEVLIARDIELARTFKARVHFCHVTTARGVELIRRAKNDHIPVTGEVTPHHLYLTEQAIGMYDTAAKMSPPLRDEEDVEQLRLGLKDGTLDAIASDHAPHDKDTKEIEFAKASFGIVGLQSNLPLLLGLVRDGVISRMRAVEAFSVSPSLAFAMETGTLKKGRPADITIVDPTYNWRYDNTSIHSKSKNSPFIGQMFQGRADVVLVNGKVKVRGGELCSAQRPI